MNAINTLVWLKSGVSLFDEHHKFFGLKEKWVSFT